MSRERLRELAGEMAAVMGLPDRSRPQLRVVTQRDFHQAESRMDPVSRDAHMQRIRYLARGYGLQWLVDQAVFDRPGIENLDDSELIGLHRDLDKAMECRREGIPFEDAGLVRQLSTDGDGHHEADDWGDPDFRLAG